jgi:hypothetical protein
MDLNLGTKGATYQSWHGDAIRVIFREIQQEHPRADEKRLVKLLTERISEEADAAKAAAEYIVKNMMNVQRAYSKKSTPEQRAKDKADIKTTIADRVQTFLLLNYQMPNGKRYRHCSGTYVATLGGAYKRVGKKAGSKLIGEVFDEDSLRTCMAIDIE